MLEEQRRDPGRHNRKAFRCGVDALDRFLTQQAVQSRGQGLGSLLLALALERCLEVRQSIGGDALLVDAKDEMAAPFYVHHGFRRLQDSPRSLYLPLGPQGDRGVDSASG